MDQHNILQKLRLSAVLVLVALVTTANFAAAEAKSTSKAACVLQDPSNQPVPVPVACAQLIITTEDPRCETIDGQHSCKVRSQMILSVSGPATCGKASSTAVPSFPQEVCTAALPARAISPWEELTFTDIPPGGREHVFTGEVCVRLSFEPDSSYRCVTFPHTVWLHGPISASLDGLILQVQSYANYLTTYAEPDPEPVVIVP